MNRHAMMAYPFVMVIGTVVGLLEWRATPSYRVPTEILRNTSKVTKPYEAAPGLRPTRYSSRRVC